MPQRFDLSDSSMWTQDGTFPDADGAAVRAYDDVVLLEATLPENDPAAAYVVPAGTIGTVLFHGGASTCPLELEMDWSEQACVIAYAMPSAVRLYQTSEQKYPR